MNIFERIVLKLRTVYRKTPVCFRWIFLPLKAVFRYLSIFRLDLWTIEGEEVSSKQHLDISYAGSEKNKNYLAKLAFGDSYKEKYLGKIWLWVFFKVIKEKRHNSSLMVAEVSTVLSVLFSKNNCFFIPCWVSGEIDIATAINSLTTRESLKSDLRRIRKNKLCFELTNELSQLNYFYYNMYLPYITKAHGNEAIVMDYDFIANRFKGCDLMLVKKDKEYIAGVLIISTKTKARLWYLGVKDGNSNYIKDGALGALYYFSIFHLKGKGFKRLGSGLTRPFLKDGVLQYKKKWGLRIHSGFSSSFLVKQLSETTGTRGFFLNNPFIYSEKNKLNSAIFLESAKPICKSDFEKLYNDYYLEGISKLFIYRYGEGDCGIREDFISDFHEKLAIHCVKDLF